MKRAMGSSLYGSTYTLSPAAKDVATTPSSVLTVNMFAVVAPKISSTRPICVLFCKKTPPLKYGICGGSGAGAWAGGCG